MTEHVRRAPETDSSTVMFLKLHAPQGRTIPNCGNKEYILQLPERAVQKNSGCAIVKKKTYFVTCCLWPAPFFVPRLKGDTAGHINSSHRGETLRDERPFLYLSSETHKGLSFCFHRMKNSARPPNVPPSVNRILVNLYLQPWLILRLN